MAKPSASKRSPVSKATLPTPATPAAPPPFSPAPSNLSPFLSGLNKSQVYITHIDRHPAAFKKRVFSVPVILNVVILLLLLWRVYAIYPTYLSLLFSVLGYSTPTSVDPTSRTWAQLAWIVAKRAFTFLLDFLLVRFIWSWPLTFFLERPANPVTWRWSVGFRDAEIYVRESRGWGAEDLLNANKKGPENPFFKVRILPAVDRTFVRSKTGYLMMGKDWDLDFAGMARAHKLLDGKEIPMESFEKSVWVYAGDEVGWCVWECWKLDEGAEEEGRRKIVEFKDRLTKMGKENLFFRWVELVQYESSQPGGFTKERQQHTVNQARKLFEEQGIDFEEFVRASGGVKELPGMEVDE